MSGSSLKARGEAGEPPGFGSGTIHIGRGDFAVAEGDGRPIGTILGSCVATCMFDPVAALGGMNHFLLPDGPRGSASAAFGSHAMELLINAVLKAGGARRNLRAKVFGGARVVAGLSDVGQRNAVFVKDFLDRDGIPCVGESLGGEHARRLVFLPGSGRVRMAFVQGRILEAPAPVPAPDGRGGELELF
ncbi:MAG: chemotaxis protein CheD [Paracoccaceae bacterium]